MMKIKLNFNLTKKKKRFKVKSREVSGISSQFPGVRNGKHLQFVIRVKAKAESKIQSQFAGGSDCSVEIVLLSLVFCVLIEFCPEPQCWCLVVVGTSKYGSESFWWIERALESATSTCFQWKCCHDFRICGQEEPRQAMNRIRILT